MSKSTWKSGERKTAKFFKTERTPLSGYNSKITHSDTLSSVFFIEKKHRKKFAIWTLYKKTRELALKENKIPIVALHELGKQGDLFVIHSDEFLKVVEAYIKLWGLNEKV